MYWSSVVQDITGHPVGWCRYKLYIYTVSKNAPTLASCSFDKQGLILIICVNSPWPFTFTYFICFLIVVTEMTRSDVTLLS